jgi:FAD/FMN-containing dehydrogenase
MVKLDSDGCDDFFPDPRPSHDPKNTKGEVNGIHLNDISRMSSFPNGTPVSKIFFPRCEADVLRILQAAHSAKKQVGIRGTKHSMG